MDMSKEWLAFLREQFPEGSRIQLRESADKVGVLAGIDDSGQFHVVWPDGQSSCVALTADRFKVLPPALETLKFYMPLTAEVFEWDDYGGRDEDYIELDGRDLLAYEEQIAVKLLQLRVPEEAERGLMHWYREPDSVNAKVHSAVFTVERRDEQLWGVAECLVEGKLSSGELETLRCYLIGQSSDGIGESFEQREIKIETGEMYVHLWQSGDEWSMETEAERFEEKIAKGLPPMCFSVLESTGELIEIERGEPGYSLSLLGTDDRAKNRTAADRENRKLGVTPEQRLAMEIGSLCGWQVPGADPRTYEGRMPSETDKKKRQGRAR